MSEATRTNRRASVNRSVRTRHAPSPVQIEARNLVKMFTRRDGTLVHALDDVSVSIMKGELVVLLGPSGCGKTTLLRCIAGLEDPSSGEIRVGDEVVYSSASRITVPPERRRGLGFMFQSYALWPHMTAFDNVAYPLRTIRVGKTEVQRQVDEMLAMLGISELAHQYPGQMSGGQQQRVALARALVNSDRAVLFDEPLSNVDARVRAQVQVELAALQRRINFSGVYVTHDQVEAMAIADRVAVMRQGKIQQLGTPREIFVSPRTRFVAEFTGSLNEITGEVVERGRGETLVRISLMASPFLVNREIEGDALWLAFRPHACRLSPSASFGMINTMRAKVVAILYLGINSEYVLDVEGHQVTVIGSYDFATEDSTVYLTVPPEAILVYPRQGHSGDDA